MACGLSKNGGWPQNMFSGRCSGANFTFQVKMDDSIDPSATYELVAFDFRSDCGLHTGKRVNLNVGGANSQPQPTQADCDSECCGKPDGYIYKNDLKLTCNPNYKRGRYVIIEGVCENGKKLEKPGCPTCRTCKDGDPEQIVTGADLAVNECTGGCEQSAGICAGLPECGGSIKPIIIRSCADASFSCPSGYSSCKKDNAIWCYRREGSESRGNEGGYSPPASNLREADKGTSTSGGPINLEPTPGKKGGRCLHDKSERGGSITTATQA